MTTPSLFAAIVAFVAPELPPESAGCADCNEAHCSRAQWEACQRRIVAEAERCPVDNAIHPEHG